MNLQMRAHITKRITTAVAVVGFVALSAGCSDLHIAVNSILGIQPPVLMAQNDTRQLFFPVKMRMPPKAEPSVEGTVQAQPPAPPKPREGVPQVQAEPPSTPKAPESAPQPQVRPLAAPNQSRGPVQAQEQPPAKAEVKQAQVLEGKRRAPGQVSATAPPTGPVAEAPKTEFKVDRDPFKPPSEVQVRTDYLPSTPLARFDYSQLKLVGVIQMAEGQIKGMVEDPDGRGYYVQPGMQIGDGANMATVTQITNRGVMLRIHKTNRDVSIPLFGERSEPERL